jgi:hypothetical protein
VSDAARPAEQGRRQRDRSPGVPGVKPHRDSRRTDEHLVGLLAAEPESSQSQRRLRWGLDSMPLAAISS